MWSMSHGHVILAARRESQTEHRNQECIHEEMLAWAFESEQA